MPDRKVIVIGVDGVRHDTLQEASTPHLDTVVKAGFLSEFSVSDQAPVNSGPLWATVATGVWPAFHGVYDNSLAGNRLASFPDFLHALTWMDKSVRTYVAAAWQPLATRIFRPPSRLMMMNGDKLGYHEADESVARDAVGVLRHDKVDAAFVCFGEPDSVAHRHGIGPEYREAVERADARIGDITAAIAERSGEEWTVIVVTDHGHRDEGGHGGRSKAESTAWLAAAGPGITRGPASHADVFPTVFAALGRTPHRGFGLVGTALQHAGGGGE
ncbi:alkaline phosphatase family protein [Streptomyces sp. NPDC048191]|uniref:alkaline phosphatase family protein n=1 Tax=Streptomyces sp. NPDC048191 TaxID=3155484 RepID=UPI0033DF7EFF